MKSQGGPERVKLHFTDLGSAHMASRLLPISVFIYILIQQLCSDNSSQWNVNPRCRCYSNACDVTDVELKHASVPRWKRRGGFRAHPNLRIRERQRRPVGLFVSAHAFTRWCVRPKLRVLLVVHFLPAVWLSSLTDTIEVSGWQMQRVCVANGDGGPPEVSSSTCFV